jgi:hypothetical protein
MTLVKRRRPEAQPIPAFMELLQRQEEALAKKRKTTSEMDSSNVQSKRTRMGGMSMVGPQAKGASKGPIGPSRGPTIGPSIGPPRGPSRGPSIGPSIGPEPPNVTRGESTASVEIHKDASAIAIGPAIIGPQPPPSISVIGGTCIGPQTPTFVEKQTPPQNGESTGTPPSPPSKAKIIPEEPT